MGNLITNYKGVTGLIAFLLVGFIYFMAVSCDSPPPKNTRASQSVAGKVHFMQYCSSCHGEDGKGIYIDSLQRQPADLTQIMKGRKSGEFPILEIANIIDGRKMATSHGTRQMPVWGEVFTEQEYLNEDEIKGKLSELIAFLMSIQ